LWRPQIFRQELALAKPVAHDEFVFEPFFNGLLRMNYFTHGYRFIERPEFLVGTMLPDMLRVSDRQVRLRSKRILPFLETASGSAHAIASGALQHLHDDDWFHNTDAFHAVTGQMTVWFREILPPEDGNRPSFLGHIVMELLLDDVLIEQHPGRLDAYYAACRRVDVREIIATVNALSPTSVQNLDRFYPLFLEEQFLRDYCEPVRLLWRINQVLRRVGLPVLGTEEVAVLIRSRELVANQREGLLSGIPHTERLSRVSVSDD